MEAIQTIARTRIKGIKFNVGKYLAEEGINPDVLPSQE